MMDVDEDQIEHGAPADGGEPVAKDEGDRKLAYRERDAAKKRAREAERRAAEAEAKLAERQAADEAAAEEAERKKNDFAALEARRKKEIDALAQKAAEAESRLAARERADRETALVDAVGRKLGANVNATLLRGVLRGLADQGVDTAPEQLDDKLAADVAKRVREVLGDLLPAKNTGSPGTPGVNLDTKAPSEKPGANPAAERVRAIAARMSLR